MAPGLEATVLLALEKDLTKRFSNVGELASAIAAYGSPVALASADRAMRVLELAGIGRPPEGGIRRGTDATIVSAGQSGYALSS